MLLLIVMAASLNSRMILMQQQVGYMRGGCQLA